MTLPIPLVTIPGTGTGRCCSSKRCGATRTVACIVRGMFMQTPFRASGYNVPFPQTGSVRPQTTAKTVAPCWVVTL